MRTLKLTIEYDGTDLCGWQAQAGADDQPTVQEALETALSGVLNEEVKVHGAGRTDAGVHARGQVAHIRTENPLAEYSLLRGVNSALRRDIAVTEIREVPSEFDARNSAVMRKYRYLIWNTSAPSPTRSRFVTHIPWALDVDAIREGCKAFEGEHDFGAFRSAQCTAERTVRTMIRCRLHRKGALIVLEYASRAFLRSQVRVMAGTLLEIGRGKMSMDMLRNLLKPGADRANAGPTAPAQGLTLMSVQYPDGM